MTGWVPVGYPDTPAPGSPDAVAQGCKCPVQANHHGAGYHGDGTRFMWVMVADCPLHHVDFTEATFIDLGHLEAGDVVEIDIDQADEPS